MATLDVFGSNAFSMVELTTAVNKQPHLPTFLNSLNMFSTKRIRTTTAAIEEVSGTIGLVQTSERGSDPSRRDQDKRKFHQVAPPRLANADKIYAREIQDIRAFGSETEMKQVQSEVFDRMMKLRMDIELTWENMRLGAVQGLVTDADATTIVDWYSTFSITQASEIDFDLDNGSPASGAVRKKCAQVVRAVLQNLKMAVPPNTQIIGLCGDAFFDDLVGHTETRETFLSQSAANELREGYAYGEFFYGGIRFVNYRGTDDGSTVSIGTDKCKFFPVVPNLFETIYAPGEAFDTINLPGQDLYAMTIPDRDRNMWVGVELYSYPLFVCTRPACLQRAKRT